MIDNFENFNKDFWEINETQFLKVKNTNLSTFTSIQVKVICNFIKMLNHVSPNIALSSIKDEEDYKVSFIYNKDNNYNNIKSIKYFIYDRDAYDLFIDKERFFYLKHFKRKQNKYIYYKSLSDGLIPLIKKTIQKNIRNNY